MDRSRDRLLGEAALRRGLVTPDQLRECVEEQVASEARGENPSLSEIKGGYDQEFAHKPSVVKHEGVVYHFYCGVGAQGRVIALATSKKLK